MTGKRRTLGFALLVGLATALLAVPVTAASAAGRSPLSEITGSVAAPTGGYAKYLAPVVRIYRLHPGYQPYAVPVRNGSYRLEVEPGVYAVVTTTWKTVGTRAVAVPRYSVVVIHRGESVRVPAAASVEPPPGGERVSIATIHMMGHGNYGDHVDAVLIPRIDEAPCPATSALNADARSELIREFRQRVSSEARPQDRLELKQALSILVAERPTLLLSGTVVNAEGVDSGRAVGSFHLTRIADSVIVWGEDFSVSSGGVEALLQRLATGVVRYACRIPETIRLDVEQTATVGSATIKWHATWDLAFDDLKTQARGVGIAVYRPTSARVTSWGIEYGGTCTGSATWHGGTISDVQGTVNLRYHGDERTYWASVGFTGPTLPITVTCVENGASHTKKQTESASGFFNNPGTAYTTFPISGDHTRTPVANWRIHDLTRWR